MKLCSILILVLRAGWQCDNNKWWYTWPMLSSRDVIFLIYSLIRSFRISLSSLSYNTALLIDSGFGRPRIVFFSAVIRQHGCAIFLPDIILEVRGLGQVLLVHALFKTEDDTGVPLCLSFPGGRGLKRTTCSSVPVAATATAHTCLHEHTQTDRTE